MPGGVDNLVQVMGSASGVGSGRASSSAKPSSSSTIPGLLD
jgi:hypothetical protein